MTVFLHELKQNRLSVMIWSAVIAFMLGVSIMIYPEMSSQMGDFSDMFANMGAFSDAFGMDQINFGEFMGYFGVECGNVLGLGGPIFAAITAVSVLAKEEKNKTAEFLLAHPISRGRIITEKLFSVITQIIVLNISVMAVSCIAAAVIGESPEWGKIALIFLAYFLLDLEVAFICFGLSAFLRRGGFAVSLGITMAFYFMNILANITDEIKFLKYITPYGYTDSGYIIKNGALDFKYMWVGLFLAAAGIITAYTVYTKKDIK
ncbi:MAG: ABC transporter permease subunit [Clostridia bacterium]|nr:ABC transporter permease subunit [Clostridia bacterium]